jgi:L-ascorbate metabolism protein UlaG (beta-lactamase superfamily)
VSLQVVFVGQSTLLIELDGVRLLTDSATLVELPRW